MKFGAIVVTFNRSELLIEAIYSLLNQSKKLSKIVIVDNASTDDTYEKLENQFNIDKSDILSYIRLNENSGGAGGFYAGFNEIIKYDLDYVSFSDDDAMFDERYFEILEDTIPKYSTVKAFCGPVYFENGDIQLSHKRNFVDDTLLREKIVSKVEYKQPFFCDIVSFVGLVVSTDILRKIGAPQKEYFIWYDDFEYCLRINKFSKILCVPELTIIHKTIDRTGSDRYMFSWKEYYGNRNLKVMAVSHGKDIRRIKNLIFLSQVKKMIGTMVKKRYRGNRRKRIKMLIESYSDYKNKKLGKNINYLP